MEKSCWENLDYPPYSFDLLTSVFSQKMKVLDSKWMATDEEVIGTVMDWVNGLAAGYMMRGLSSLCNVDKCLNCKRLRRKMNVLCI
jgi:hypothetical protein